MKKSSSDLTKLLRTNTSAAWVADCQLRKLRELRTPRQWDKFGLYYNQVNESLLKTVARGSRRTERQNKKKDHQTELRRRRSTLPIRFEKVIFFFTVFIPTLIFYPPADWLGLKLEAHHASIYEMRIVCQF